LSSSGIAQGVALVEGDYGEFWGGGDGAVEQSEGLLEIAPLLGDNTE
jgi:hypothetical protein